MVTKVRSSVLDTEVITALTVDSTPDIINDYMLVYDTSAGTFKKVALHKTFPSGTRMAFQQNNAPTGWTKDTATALNDSAMRIVTGNVTSGGSTAFSTFNGQTAVGATTLSLSQIPSHQHNSLLRGATSASGSGTNVGVSGVGSAVAPSTQAITAEGGGGSHNHTITTSIKYYDFIIASKD